MSGHVYGGFAELMAKRFHETYERLAPEFGYRTREASAVAWPEVPPENRRLMTAVLQELIDSGHVVAPYPPTSTTSDVGGGLSAAEKEGKADE